MHKNMLWSVMKPLVTNLAILTLLSTLFLSSSLAAGVKPLPGLQKAVEDIRFHHKGEGLSFLAEKEYQVRKYYYEIQSKMQKLEILEEVKEHFEKAVTKSEFTIRFIQPTKTFTMTHNLKNTCSTISI